MSAIITGVIKLTFGFLLTKVRDHTAKRLDEGDPADEIFRKLIMRERNNIKASIIAIARTDLNSSISRLKEGINLLNISIEKSENAETRFGQVKEPTDVFDGALALSQATEEFKITHENRFAFAKESLKNARDKATDAFGDEALSTEERIFAAKLRVISRILESLEDPEAAVATCKGYLEELHDLRAVQKTFTRYLDGGITAIFGKEKRREYVASVTVINFVLFDFTRRFTKLPLNLFKWPRIELSHGDGTYHPMLADSEILEQSGAQPTNQISSSESAFNLLSVVNSKREIITWDFESSINVFDTTTGAIRLFCRLSKELTGTGTRTTWVFGIAIDGCDNVYTVLQYEATGGVRYTFLVLDTTGFLKHQSPLEFLKGKGFVLANRLALSKDRIIIHHDRHIWVCDHSGKLKHKFRLARHFSSIDVCVSNKNEIIVAERRGRFVYIFTGEGESRKAIEVPEGHKLQGVAFNHTTKQFVVVSRLKDYYILTNYSEIGEEKGVLKMPLGTLTGLQSITSHPSSPVALFYGQKVMFIQ